jgi:hypothetical protein
MLQTQQDKGGIPGHGFWPDDVSLVGQTLSVSPR